MIGTALCPRLRSLAALGALAASVVAGRPAPAPAKDPGALWRIVHTECVPDMARFDDPEPCTQVDPAGDYAVLKDRVGRFQFLLIPTVRITGIEDPALLEPQARNYWQDAWHARRFLEVLAGRPLPRDAISLAVNAVSGRSQDQLHIHIDCLRADILAALRGKAGVIGKHWAPFPLAGRPYRAMRVSGADLEGANPFQLLAEMPGARQDMALQTLVVAGATFPDGTPGFYLLADRADLAAGDRGNGESLQDHACRLADRPMD